MRKETTVVNNVSGGGVSLGTALTVAFVVLKLMGIIHWSWLWVLSPLWIPLIVVGVLLLLMLPLLLIGLCIAAARPTPKSRK